MRELIRIIETYQEEDGSAFSSNGVSYDLNYLFVASQHLPVRNILVNDLRWVLNHEDVHDERRVAAADTSVPLLVTKEHNRIVVVDGFHRLVSAVRNHISSLPSIMIPRKIMLMARKR